MTGPGDVCSMCRNHRYDQTGRCPHCDQNAHPVNSTCVSCLNALRWDGSGPTGETKRREGL